LPLLNSKLTIEFSSTPSELYSFTLSTDSFVKSEPMITSGKYEKVGSQLLMPVNIKVHHATVDGYHVSLFFDKLQREMNR